MSEKHLTSFLIGFSLMFVAHYLLEPTFKVGEPKPNSLRVLLNYSVGVIGISISLLYLRPDVWLDLLVSIIGAGFATALAHGRDWVVKLYKKDLVDGLINQVEAQER